jgi:hypothetical protein
VLSTAYLAWGVWAQQQVTGVARAALAAQGIVAERLLVTPAPLNTLLWRVVAVQGDVYHEGFRSLRDSGPGMVFDRFDRGTALWPAVQGLDGAQRIAAFSHGFYALDAKGRPPAHHRPAHGPGAALQLCLCGRAPGFAVPAAAGRAVGGWDRADRAGPGLAGAAHPRRRRGSAALRTPP